MVWGFSFISSNNLGLKTSLYVLMLPLCGDVTFLDTYLFNLDWLTAHHLLE
jgi:hypothetical protein